MTKQGPVSGVLSVDKLTLGELTVAEQTFAEVDKVSEQKQAEIYSNVPQVQPVLTQPMPDQQF